MKSLGSGLKSKLLKVLERIVETFRSDEVLSDFERGQLDGLRWAIQVISELDE